MEDDILFGFVPTGTPAKGSASLNGISAVPTAILKGKAWVFGDDINTDIIIPFRFKSRTNDPYEMAKYAMYGIDPHFHKKISKGDLIVGGKNFGGGSKVENKLQQLYSTPVSRRL